MVPAVSIGISPVPTYSGYPPSSQSFQYGTITLYRLPSQTILVRLIKIMQVLQPQSRRNGNGLGSSAFARHYLRNHYYFLLLQVLRCFSSLGLLSLRNSLYRLGCPIRISTDQLALANPRSFSQLITSFFASESLGIPRAPLFTYSTLPYQYGTLLQFLLNMSMNLLFYHFRRKEAINRLFFGGG